jgi:(p)ppGpp synthase/HD superfamily hydrolase
LKTAPLEVKLVSCADKLSNILSMIKDKEEEGDKLWERFNAGYESQKWYYRELLKSLSDLESYEMYRDFQGCVRQLFDLG